MLIYCKLKKTDQKIIQTDDNRIRNSKEKEIIYSSKKRIYTNNNIHSFKVRKY